MTDLILSSCKNCFILPSLGQLPSLKKLRISYLDALVTIDDSFYKDNNSSLLTPFPLLESLEFNCMPCWEVWSPTEPCTFPKLKCLKIENCPKLRRDLPSHLPALKRLTIRSCMQLASSLPRAAAIRSLEIIEDLKKMPNGMGNLDPLQHLNYYIVGKHDENGIKELGGLSNLRGSLSIEKLENVNNGSEALAAKIMDKKYISHLFLTWSSADHCIDSQTEMDILCKLQPHQDLQLLEIEGYWGTRFPDWVGYSSYHNMTDLVLSYCKNCCILPSLGQLPSLKKLRISYLDALVTIDDSFYKDNNSSLLTPFPLLESLEFHCMSCWEVWSPTEPCAFPKLKCLTVEYCPKLRRELPSHLPALEILTIKSCMQLASSLPRAPAIDSSQIIESGKVALQELPLSIESRSMHNSCDSLTSLPLEAFPNLKYLTIENCENLESLSASGDSALQNLNSLSIFKCPNLVSLEGFPLPNMTRFVIDRCDKLKSLPQQMNTLLPKLEELKISYCSEIESFPEGGMPPSLRSIESAIARN